MRDLDHEEHTTQQSTEKREKNRASTHKVWRFSTQNASLRAKFIKGIHGNDGKLGSIATHHHPSIWLDIVREAESLKHQGIDLSGFIRKKMGKGLASMEREILFPSYLYPKPTTEDNHGDNNDDGWQIANQRQNTKVYGTQHIITSYFFTEFPPGLSETALWKTFAKYGRITDVYMAKNPTINGKAFGFARFINVQNLKSFETTLNSIVIGTHHLKVNIARFQRGKTNNHVDTNPARQPTTTPLHLQQPTNTHKHKTYDSVRIGNDVGDSKDISSPQSSKSDNIQNENFTGLILENSNIQVEGEIQISPQSGSCNMDTFMYFVPDTHIEERSPCTQVLKTIEVGSLLGFNMVGKEDMVRQTIGDNIVQS
ncbi:RNA-directed DNA polymerase, eukaryota [Tanacetum coccineum]